MTGDPIPPVLLVGMGRMGGAMMSGWRDLGLTAPSYAVDPAAAPSPAYELSVVTDASDLPHDFDPQAIVLALKPQMATLTLPAYARFQGVFLSVMAGATVARIADLLGGNAAVVRAMPNTPAAIRQGITVAYAGPGVTEGQRALCDTLLGAVGEVAWVADEALLDPVTAVSGGGPAYVFLLVELLERAAVEQGIDPPLARLLARQTVSGSGALLAATTEDASELRRAVTSPSGTTERALAVLMAEWPDAVSRAIAAATERSRELAR